MVQDLRQIIRDILIEELAGHGLSSAGERPPQVREELVSIESDRDLAKFVERVLHVARDDRSRADVESGRLVFRLARSGASRSSARRHPAAQVQPTGRTQSFATGLITEKQIHRLPDDVNVISLGGSAVLTPLAKDAVRQAGIKIERTKS